MTQKQEIILTAYDDLNESVVSINHEAIQNFKLSSSQLSLMPSGLAPAWLEHPQQAIAYYIALNSINYRFWDLGPGEGAAALQRYSFEGDRGAIGMRRAFDKVWGTSFRPENFRAQAITSDWVVQNFGDIPDPQSRAEILSAVFSGSILEELSAELHARFLANQAVSADDAMLLHKAFPRAFDDAYLKRSQLAVAWMAGYFAEANVKLNVADLTAFIDYQVPRIQRACSILVYSPELAQKVDSCVPLPEGGYEERAIRGASALACREMAKVLGVADAEVDNPLWHMRNMAGTAPFHLTFTEKY